MTDVTATTDLIAMNRRSLPQRIGLKMPALRIPDWPLSPETMLLLSCVFFVAVFNLPFWRSAIGYEAPVTAGSLLDLALIGVAIACLHFLVLLPFLSRFTTRPLLAILFIAGASATFYSWSYSTYFDVSMINNILETDYHESRQLMTPRFLLFVAVFGALPAGLITAVRLPEKSLAATARRRIRFALAAFAVLLVALLLSFQSFSSLMRNHKELRYLIAPGNVLVSLPRALAGKAEAATLKKQAIGLDARVVESGAGSKPRLVVLVVGETQRAANWGMNGYPRNTTPRLARRADIINFADVTSCGTSTAVSVPCMFSGQGRERYSEHYARSHESLLDLVRHAGVGVEWIDNQSGCKGVCDGVETDRLTADRFPESCKGGECMDEALITDLQDELEEHQGNQLLVLHLMGSHGPAYYQRYPASVRRFLPTCDSDDLSQCSREQVVNSYDNSILYADYVLNRIVDTLGKAKGQDTALIFVSDHGESLGEMGVYLHGLPYMIAPPEQTHVPMFWWLSESFQQHSGLDSHCLRDVAEGSASHDNIFHSVIGLLGIETASYNPALDLGQPCRQQLAGQKERGFHRVAAG